MSDDLEEEKAWTDAAEPWEPWETGLCLWSLGIGIGALVILGILFEIVVF